MCCPISVDFASFTQISFGQKGSTVGSTLLFKFFSGTFRGHGFTAPSPYHATKITLHQGGIPVQLIGIGGGWHLLLGLARCSRCCAGVPHGHWEIPQAMDWCIPSTGHGTTVPNLDPEIEEKMPIATWRDVFYLSVSIYIYLDLSMSIYIYLAYWRAWVYHLIIPMLSKIIFPSQNCSQHPIDPYIYIYIIYTSPFQAENCVNREVEATNSIQFSPTWLPAASKSLGAHLSLGSGAG